MPAPLELLPAKFSGRIVGTGERVKLMVMIYSVYELGVAK
jgi:hypothetical protein